MDNATKAPARLYLTMIWISLAICLACLVYPIYVIRPFRAQGANELAAALVVLRMRSVLTALCVLIAGAATVRYWTLRPRIWKRILVAAAAVTACIAAVLCHVNIYELMFHPNARPEFTAAGQSKLDGDEKVIAVRLGSAARAYPIRDMSYHHVINDVVGGVPIAPTY